MKPLMLRAFLEPRVFADLRLTVDDIASYFESDRLHDPRFGRHVYHNTPCLRELHTGLASRVSTLVGVAVKPSYNLLSIYRDGGVCPAHLDRPQCRYTIDLCVSQGRAWPLYIEDVSYVLEPNDAVLYEGTRDRHWRETIDTGNYCRVALFHYVDVGFEGRLD